jgi:hypothetical protein
LKINKNKQEGFFDFNYNSYIARILEVDKRISHSFYRRIRERGLQPVTDQDKGGPIVGVLVLRGMQ